MRVTQKGQVTIPLEVRRALGIRPGTEVWFDSSVLLDVFTRDLPPS
jgi:AbrB family looped-hinge helix DNA binding protein